jgi:hypothetical protein
VDRVLTNGTGNYCATAQEDNATFEVLLRSSIHKLTDAVRITMMREKSVNLWIEDRSRTSKVALSSCAARSRAHSSRLLRTSILLVSRSWRVFWTGGTLLLLLADKSLLASRTKVWNTTQRTEDIANVVVGLNTSSKQSVPILGAGRIRAGY